MRNTQLTVTPLAGIRRWIAFLLAVGSLPLTLAAEEVRVALSGDAWEICGQSEVPRGLFGVHAVGIDDALIDEVGVELSRQILKPPRGSSLLLDKQTGKLVPAHARLAVFIDCQGDRYSLPFPLIRKDWKEVCQRLGREYGETWKRIAAMESMAGKRGVVQWWNEAYLNWAERSAGGTGSTINQGWYDLDRVTEDGPVFIKGWTEPLAHFRWRSLWPVRYEVDPQPDGQPQRNWLDWKSGHTPATPSVPNKPGEPQRRRLIGWNIHLPEGAQTGTTFRASETRYWRKSGEHEWTVEKQWFPYDPTAISYYSGRQNLDFYRWSFGAYAKALRETNPDVTILAGWDFNFEEGGWWVWRELYRPLLREFPDLIDGVTEHHYGTQPARVQVWYEVAAADGAAIMGRPLRSWNTECQGRLDPEVHGVSTNPPSASLLEAHYALADIIGLAAHMPDKVGSRSTHNFGGFKDSGAAWALRLLKPLRGKLLHVNTTDTRVWTVASSGVGEQSVIACCNQRPDPIEVVVSATGRVGQATICRLVSNSETGRIDIARQTLSQNAGDLRFGLASHEAVVVLVNTPKPSGVRIRHQHFAREGALIPPGPQGTTTATVVLTSAELAVAQAASLRLVLDGEEGVAVQVNDRALAESGNGAIRNVDMDKSWLVPGENRIKVVAAKATVAAVSVILDSRR